MGDENKRLAMFGRYIHTNQCSDEGGWFAFFTPDGEVTASNFDTRVSGCATEEEAIHALIGDAFAALEKWDYEVRLASAGSGDN